MREFILGLYDHMIVIGFCLAVVLIAGAGVVCVVSVLVRRFSPEVRVFCEFVAVFVAVLFAWWLLS